MSHSPYHATIIIPTLLSQPRLLKANVASLNRLRFLLTSSPSIQPPIQIILIANTAQAKLNRYKPALTKLITQPNLDLGIICQGKNTGFTGAVNAGIRVAQANLIALLNDDTVVHPDWLDELIITQKQTQAAMVASKIYLADKKTLDSQGFGFAWRGKAEALDHNLHCSLSQEQDYWLAQPDLLPTTTHQEPFGPDAAAALYTKELFEQIGLFDESFFAYLEDVELALRARQAGRHCVLARNAIVYHHKHASSTKMKAAFKAKQDWKNWWRIVLKRYPKQAWCRFGLRVLVERGRNVVGWVRIFFA